MEDELDVIARTSPDEEHMGAAMRKLNPRQRRFVCALAIYGGDQQAAYAYAGYHSKDSNVAGAASSRLANSADVVEAIKEEAWRRLDTSTLLAVSGLIELASCRNEDKATRIKAQNSLLDRVKGFAGKSEHTVFVKDERTTAELVSLIKELAAPNGLKADELLGLPAPIDAVYEEVTDDFLEGCV